MQQLVCAQMLCLDGSNMVSGLKNLRTPGIPDDPLSIDD